MLGSPKWSLSLRFPHQYASPHVCASPLPVRATFPSHLSLLDFITRTILGEEYRSFSSLCYLLTCLLHGIESFLWSQPVFSLSKNSPHFMEPEGSLPYSQVPATCPYPEPARSSPYPHFPLPKSHLNIILPSAPESPQWSLSLRFPHQKAVHASPLPHTRSLLCYLEKL